MLFRLYFDAETVIIQCHNTLFFCCIMFIHVISLERESGRFSFHFRKVFQKCIEYIGRLLIHFREISYFSKKLYNSEES